MNLRVCALVCVCSDDMTQEIIRYIIIFIFIMDLVYSMFFFFMDTECVRFVIRCRAVNKQNCKAINNRNCNIRRVWCGWSKNWLVSHHPPASSCPNWGLLSAILLIYIFWDNKLVGEMFYIKCKYLNRSGQKFYYKWQKQFSIWTFFPYNYFTFVRSVQSFVCCKRIRQSCLCPFLLALVHNPDHLSNYGICSCCSIHGIAHLVYTHRIHAEQPWITASRSSCFMCFLVPPTNELLHKTF